MSFATEYSWYAFPPLLVTHQLVPDPRTENLRGTARSKIGTRSRRQYRFTRSYRLHFS